MIYKYSGCSNLTSVTIPNSVTSIGSYAFYGCSNLTSVTIPNSVTSIGFCVFSDCSGLTSIIVEKGNTYYDSRNNCNAIIETKSNTLVCGCMNTIIPNSVTSIGWAFGGCSGLTSITIPNSVTRIYDYAFSGCTGLTSITVEKGNTKYDSRDNCNAIIETNSNKLIQGCKNTVIPNSVTSIGDYAFYGCESLTSIEIPNSVTSIGSYAFRNSSSLTSVTIPNSVTSIGSSAFYGCSGLTSITIPNSVTSIGNSAFYGCSNLTSITIPNSVKSIGSSAFSGTKWYDDQPDGLVYAGKILYKYKGTMPSNTKIDIKEGTIGIAGSALYKSGLSSVTIPNSVTSIGDSAFYNCWGLTSITIPNSVTSIGGFAFHETKWYDDQADGVIYAGKIFYAYKGYMHSTTKIDIKEGTIGIAGHAFSGCYNNLTSVTIPNSVTTIGESAFSSCNGLTSITIPNSVTSIGNNAFEYCSGLTSFIIPNSVTNIGSSAFMGCFGLTSIIIFAEDPPVMDGNSFNDNVTIHVLPGCKAKYEAANYWQDYNIVEDATNGIDTVKGTPTISSDKIFSISGQQLNKTKKGVNIINGKKILVK